MVLETVEGFWKLVSKDRFPKLNDFEFKNRNRMADETLDDSLRLAPLLTRVLINEW